MTLVFHNLDGAAPFKKIVSGRCPHCEHQTTLAVRSHQRLDGSGFDLPDTQHAARFLLHLRCDWCKKDSGYVRLAETVSLSVTPGGPVQESYKTLSIAQVWPDQKPRDLAPEVPPLVREVFSEAALAEAAGAFRLAGVGYRAAVEQIVKDKGASGSNLNQRILALAGMGVPQDVVDAFHEARFVGNDAAHDALAYSADEIADIAELIKEAVLVLYVQPAQRARMAAQRAARRTAAKQATP